MLVNLLKKLKVVIIMSNYTTTLRFICESSPETHADCIETFTSYELSDYLTQNQIDVIENANTWTKNKLANKIIRYYYFREIGFETWALFKHHAKIEMEMLMEYYLPLIYSRCIEYDPLINVDYTETYTSSQQGNNTSNGTETSSSAVDSTGENKFSDTPNVGLDNIKKGTYLTNATLSDNKNTASGESHSTATAEHQQTRDYTKNIRGNSGVSATAQKMIEQFRENIIAIDHEIIEKLNPLFMGIY